MEENKTLEEQQAAAKKAEEITAEQMKKMQQEMPKEMAKSMAKQELNAAVSHALPDEVNQLRWAGLRGIPVVGSIIQWLDNIKWFRSMFGGSQK
ncbi:MAG: hypothetical protein K5896_06530 [Prevotella sp.]|jgi:glucan biosynthesis protein|nr:hypothetical protein [Prevotella sp.]